MTRFLTPLSELFIALSLVFFALFFLSAGQTGSGDERPLDKLHLVSVAWKIPNRQIPEELLDNSPYTSSTPTLVPEKEWMSFVNSFVAAADPENVLRKFWPYVWGPNVQEWNEWLSVRSKRCETLAPVNARYNAVPRDLDSARPSQALARLGSPSDVAISVSARQTVQVREDIRVERDFVKEPTFVGLLQESESELAFAYRPQDMARPIHLQFIIPLIVNEASKYFSIGFEPDQYHVSISVTDAGGEVQDSLTIVEKRVAGETDLVLSVDGNLFSEGTLPVYHKRSNCEGLRHLRVFLTLSPDGVSVTFRDPMEAL